jgi:hypothetical protein
MNCQRIIGTMMAPLICKMLARNIGFKMVTIPACVLKKIFVRIC